MKTIYHDGKYKTMEINNYMNIRLHEEKNRAKHMITDQTIRINYIPNSGCQYSIQYIKPFIEQGHNEILKVFIVTVYPSHINSIDYCPCKNFKIGIQYHSKYQCKHIQAVRIKFQIK